MFWHIELVLSNITILGMKFADKHHWRRYVPVFEDTIMEKGGHKPYLFLSAVAYLSDDRLQLYFSTHCIHQIFQ